MNTITIKANSAKYLSEIEELKEGLPTGVFNKKSPDCGGTYLCMNCNTNYILVSPSKNLVDSIAGDRKNTKNILGVRAGVFSEDIKEYINNNEIKKIAVTWESMFKVVDTLKELGQDLSTYSIVLDEYHLIISNYGFRDTAINSVMKLIQEFNHYTFMSASPIKSKYAFSFLKDIPHYEVEWNNNRNVYPIRIRSNSPLASVCTLINKFKVGMELEDISGNLKKVEELYIFINSVESIKSILDKTELHEDDVKILVGDNVRNKLILDKYVINNCTDPNKPITFITSTGFQGINIESNNALNVVVSDGSKKHTFVNIDRDILQIAGRQRTNNEYKNCFRDRIWHIYSFNSNPDDYDRIETEIDALKKEAINSISGINKLDGEEYNGLLGILRKVEDRSFIIVEGNTPTYSDIKEMYLREQNEIKNYVYTNGIRIREAYEQAGFNTNKQHYKYDEDHIKMCNKVGFKELWEAYNSDEFDSDQFDREYPLFKEIKKYVSESEIKHLMYVEDKIVKRLHDNKMLDSITLTIFNQIGEGFIESSKLKELYAKQFKKHGIKSAPKASLIERAAWLECKKTTKSKYTKDSVLAKPVNGYEIKKKFILNNTNLISK